MSTSRQLCRCGRRSDTARKVEPSPQARSTTATDGALAPPRRRPRRAPRHCARAGRRARAASASSPRIRSYGPLDRPREQLGRSAPGRKLRGRRARACGELLALGGIVDQPAQRRGERRRRRRAGPARRPAPERSRGSRRRSCRSPAGRARSPPHRPCRSPRSATAARTGRTPHKARRGARPATASSMRDARRQPMARDVGLEPRGRRGIAAAVAHDGEAPGQIDQAGERLDQHVIALARHDGADGEQRDRAAYRCRCDQRPRSVPGGATVMRSAGTP